MRTGSGWTALLVGMIVTALIITGCQQPVEETIGSKPDPILDEPEPGPPIVIVIALDDRGRELTRGTGLLTGESLVVSALDLIEGASVVTIRIEYQDDSDAIELERDTTHAVMVDAGLASFMLDRPTGFEERATGADLAFGDRLTVVTSSEPTGAVYSGIAGPGGHRWQAVVERDVPLGAPVLDETNTVIGVVTGPVAGRQNRVWVAAGSDVSRLSRLNRPVALPAAARPNPPPEETLNPADQRISVEARGIYLTAYTAGNPRSLGRMVDLINRTELNAMVIDVKDSTGQLMYPSQVPLAVEIGATTTRIADLAELAGELREHGIYLIARLVVFQDPWLGSNRLDLAVQHVSGGIWREPSGLSWVDPHSVEVWDYNLGIAKEVIAAGFHEIQFDYVRFPSDGNLRACVYPHADGHSKSEVIRDFLAYSRDELSVLGAWTAADIYGLVPTALDDVGIGQQYEMVIEVVDYVCPMAYPSHYGPGVYGLPNPDAAPYHTVLGTLKDAARRHGNSPAIVRPWLQDFSLGHRYGADEVRAQIQAVYDAGFSEWLLWSPGNRYSEAGLLPAVVPELEDLR